MEISAPSSVPDFASDSTILYLINGRTGRLLIENNVVFFGDLIQGLTGRPSGFGNARSEEVRSISEMSNQFDMDLASVGNQQAQSSSPKNI